MLTYATQTPNDNLPFYEIFNALQKSQEFSLGIEEYFAFLAALGSFGIDEETGDFDKTKIWELCKLLWLKPNQSYALFENYFQENYPKLREVTDSESDREEELPEKNPGLDALNQEKMADKSSDKTSESKNQDELPPPQQTAQKTRFNVKLSEEISNNTITQAEREGVPIKKFLLTDDYLPLQRRQLLQLWRSLPQKRKSGSTSNIDLATTTREAARNGFLPKIYYEPAYEIINHILVLTDHDGSMVAFDALNDLLTESLQEAFPSPKKQENNISRYYFYNVPQEYVYTNQAHTNFVKIDKLIQKHKQQRVAVIFVSDAGAARGGNSSGRVQANLRALFKFQTLTSKIVWLNPMPRERWTGTSAARIANFVPMYACERGEISRAVLYLKGKNIQQET